MEKIRTRRIRTEKNTVFFGNNWVWASSIPGRFAFILILRLYHPPMLINKIIASNARAENQIIFDCPYGTIIKAASNGPIELPKLPPS